MQDKVVMDMRDTVESGVGGILELGMADSDHRLAQNHFLLYQYSNIITFTLDKHYVFRNVLNLRNPESKC